MNNKDMLELLEIKSNEFDGINELDLKCSLLLFCIHKGYNSDVWSSKMLRYWPAFEDKLLLTIGNDNLETFITAFTNEMSATLGNTAVHRNIIKEIIISDNNQIINRIRNAYKVIILYTRLILEATKQ